MHACSAPGKAVAPVPDPRDATGSVRQPVAFTGSRDIIASEGSRLRRRPAPTAGRHHPPGLRTARLWDLAQFGPAAIKNLGFPGSTQKLLSNRRAARECRSHSQHGTRDCLQRPRRPKSVPRACTPPCQRMNPLQRTTYRVPAGGRGHSTTVGCQCDPGNPLASAAACRHRMLRPVSLTETRRSRPCGKRPFQVAGVVFSRPVCG